MEIMRAESGTTKRGNEAYFSGVVWLDEVIKSPPETGVNVFRVTFTPGARTAWHTHPKGQILHIEAGAGRVQTWGGVVQEVRPGDTVYFAPGEKHWHGATPDRLMVHLAIQPVEAGVDAVWLEQVTDAEYAAGAAG